MCFQAAIGELLMRAAMLAIVLYAGLVLAADTVAAAPATGAAATDSTTVGAGRTGTAEPSRTAWASVAG